MRIHPGKETRKRKRIAFMLASIHSGASTKVWPQILSESEKRQCALFVFPGGRLASHDESEYMRNGIFDLVNSCSFDGAICWASSLSGFASEKQVETFLLSRISIPLVTFGLKIGGMPVVNIDAYAGMKQLVSHLARRHSCRKIAYIGGPTAHSSAEERFKAYRDALDESGLRYDCRLASLDNAWDDGRRAMTKLLDERSLKPGLDFDAFCAASDLLAFEAAKLLQERGFRIPADIAMGGFNDSDESNPPVSHLHDGSDALRAAGSSGFSYAYRKARWQGTSGQDAENKTRHLAILRLSHRIGSSGGPVRIIAMEARRWRGSCTRGDSTASDLFRG